MIGTIHVCISCQTRELVRRRGGEGSSTASIDTLQGLLAQRSWAEALTTGPAACLGPCGDAPRVALIGAGRWRWLFQDQQATQDIQAFAVFLRAWLQAPEGLPVKIERPAPLMRKTIGRIPPVEQETGVR